MTYRIPSIILLVLVSYSVCLGQSSFQGLTPGKSTRSDVARVLGQPVRNLSETLSEYSPPPGTNLSKVYVQYRKGSQVVELIETRLLTPVEHSSITRELNLPQGDALELNAQGNLMVYFGGQALIVLTYASDKGTSGVSRIGYYSRELFDSEVGRSPGLSATEGNRSSEYLLRQIIGKWKSHSGHLVEVRNNGEAIYLEPSELAAAHGAKAGDAIFRNARVVGNLIVADQTLHTDPRVCQQTLTKVVQITIRVDPSTNRLLIIEPLYHIDRDSNGICSWTDKVEIYQLGKWTRVSDQNSR